MKKFLFLILPLLALSACEYDDADLKKRIDDLNDRVAELEAKVEALNSDITTLRQLIDGKRFISDVTANEDGSHTLTLVTSNGESSTLTIKNGTDAPAIGVKQDTDGKYYWTLDGEFILAGGSKLPVSGQDGITPEFKIDKGVWYVSYDKGTSWKECGKASADQQVSPFKSVSVSDDGKLVFITLNDGRDTVLTFELYVDFGIAFDTVTGGLRVGEKLSIPFTLTGADDKTRIETIADAGWTAEVKLAEGGGTIDVTAPSGSSTGKVIVLVNDGGSKTLMRTLTFVAGILNVSTSSLRASGGGGTLTAQVETDLEYEVFIPADAGWITLAETRGDIRRETLTFRIGASTLAEERQAVVELRSNGSTIETILIYQLPYFDPAAMVFKVEAKVYTGTNAKYTHTVCLPLFGQTNVAIDWGDGTAETSDAEIKTAAAMLQHTYTEAGTYYVAVTGTAAQLNGNLTPSAMRPAILEVIQWGKLGLTSMLKAFYGNTSLTGVPLPEEGSFAALTSVESMFSGCTNLKSVPEDLFAQATELTSVASLFYGCSSLETVSEKLFGNNAKITSAASLFYGCKKLVSVPSELFRNQSEITTLGSLFYNCSSLETVPEALFRNQSANTNLSSLFYGCSSLRSIPSSLFDTQTEVTTIYSMFKGCKALTELPEGVLDTFSKVTNMGSLFSGCTALGNLPDDLFLNLTGVTTANYLYEGCVAMSEFPSIKNCTALKSVNAMWKDCSTLVSAPADYFPDCQSIRSDATSIAYMFQNCKALTMVPADLFARFENTTYISQIFENCTSLESLPVGLFDSMTQLVNVSKAFSGCVNFTGESPYTVVNGEKIHLYERAPENGFVKIEKNFTDCFKNCTKIADRAQIPIAWGGLSDGTKAKPTLTLSLGVVEGAEYHSIAMNVKGTELKSGRMGLFTKEQLNRYLEEMGGSYEKVCNRNCSPMTAGWLADINSETGLSDTSESMEAGTDYVLLVSGTNAHGTTVATAEVRTADFPTGEANYERYIGTWNVTSASSEITGQPLTFTVEIKPYRINSSYKVSSWGITTWGDDYPFLMDYLADGTLSISTMDNAGYIGGYYVYLTCRFYNPDVSGYSLWLASTPLGAGHYNSDQSVTIEGLKFTDKQGAEHTVSGLEYALYQNSTWYEHADYFKPGFTISDYTVGPYKLTRASSAGVPARSVRQNGNLLESAAPPTAVPAHPGVQKIKKIGK